MRKPMVTRTFITTKATVIALNLETNKAEEHTVSIPRTYKDDKKLFKKVAEAFDTDSLKAVKIINSEEVETLYGMPEDKFIANAVELDPETRKILEAESEEA